MTLTQTGERPVRNIAITVAGVLLFIVLVLAVFVFTTLRPAGVSRDAMQELGLFLFEQPRALPHVELVDQAGEPFVTADLTGKWTLLFFGFTYCPDICPTTMAQLSQFLRQLEPRQAAQTRVMLVSVDPARDTPEKLAEYVRYFNPNFRGLTGEFLTLQQFATALNAPFVKQRGAGDNYLVEHGANVALLDAEGHYIGFFRAPLNVEHMVRAYQAVRTAW